MNSSPEAIAEREKKRVALSSVLAAIFLTGMKLVVGLLTGSLGILAEAAHSGLDLVAAGVTYFAVRVSGRPPDVEHHYGHGKVENLSALIETLLLLGTCVWIIYEAVIRLFFQTVHVKVNFWSFLVMGASIAIDYGRSRALMRTAKKHRSQALEADALHFSTDVWSSMVVILGLVAVLLGGYLQDSHPGLAPWLYRADAIAALGVSAIVIYISIRLGQRTISALTDQAPKGLRASIRQELARLPGVLDVKQVRARQSGPSTFVDLVLTVKADTSVDRGHDIAAEAENVVQRLVPNSDVMVHVEPAGGGEVGMVDTIRGIATAHGVEVHSLAMREVDGRQALEMHAEVPDNLDVGDAHERISAMEESLRLKVPGIGDIVIHIEPSGDATMCSPAVESLAPVVQDAVRHLLRDFPSLRDCHDVSVKCDRNNELALSFHCSVSSELGIAQAHELTTRMESLLRQRFPELVRVLIHVEPDRPD